MNLYFKLRAAPAPAAAASTARAGAPALPFRPALLGLFALLGSAGWAGPALAQSGPAKVTQLDHESLRVRIDNPRQQPGLVRVVRLSTGQVLFNETYNAPAYGHRFSFDNLPAGRYALLLRVGPARYRYTMQVVPVAQGTIMAVRDVKMRGVENENTLATTAF